MIRLENKSLLSLIVIGITGCTFILIYTLLFHHSFFCYDEPHYLNNIALIHQYGLGKDFLIHMYGPAGPLHAYIHIILEPLTHLGVLQTRLVNILLSIGIVYIMYKVIQKMHPDKKNMAFLFFAIPMTYPTVGMALTEIPAMVFFCIALWVIVSLNSFDHQSSLKIILILAGSLCLSLSIMGRQPYILCSGVLFISPLLTVKKKEGYNILILSILSLIIPFMLFYVWKGLAPSKGGDLATQKFIEPIHLLLALGYGMLIMILLSYRFFTMPKKRDVIVYTLLFILLIPVSRVLNLHFTPMSTLSQKILTPLLFSYYGSISFCILTIIGVYFLQNMVRNNVQNRSDPYYVLFSLMLLAVLSSSIKVTHLFSSRYIFQAAPLFLILASYHYQTNDKRQKAIHYIGVLIGMLSLINYC